MGDVLERVLVQFRGEGRHHKGRCELCEYLLFFVGYWPWNGRYHEMPLPIYDDWLREKRAWKKSTR